VRIPKPAQASFQSKSERIRGLHFCLKIHAAMSISTADGRSREDNWALTLASAVGILRVTAGCNLGSTAEKIVMIACFVDARLAAIEEKQHRGATRSRPRGVRCPQPSPSRVRGFRFMSINPFNLCKRKY
jgi:hypothetical protein